MNKGKIKKMVAQAKIDKEATVLAFYLAMKYHDEFLLMHPISVQHLLGMRPSWQTEYRKAQRLVRFTRGHDDNAND